MAMTDAVLRLVAIIAFALALIIAAAGAWQPAIFVMLAALVLVEAT